VPEFFEKCGFPRVAPAPLPPPLWSACVPCPPFPACGALPLLSALPPPPAAPPAALPSPRVWFFLFVACCCRSPCLLSASFPWLLCGFCPACLSLPSFLSAPAFWLPVPPARAPLLCPLCPSSLSRPFPRPPPFCSVPPCPAFARPPPFFALFPPFCRFSLLVFLSVLSFAFASFPVCPSLPWAPPSLAASLCSSSASLPRLPRLPASCPLFPPCLLVFFCAPPSRPPSVVLSCLFSGPRVLCSGFVFPALSPLSGAVALSRFPLVPPVSLRPLPSRSCLCLRSSLRCPVLLSAPPRPARAAAVLGSGSPVFLACRRVAPCSLFPPPFLLAPPPPAGFPACPAGLPAVSPPVPSFSAPSLFSVVSLAPVAFRPPPRCLPSPPRSFPSPARASGPSPFPLPPPPAVSSPPGPLPALCLFPSFSRLVLSPVAPCFVPRSVPPLCLPPAPPSFCLPACSSPSGLFRSSRAPSGFALRPFPRSLRPPSCWPRLLFLR